ncbi:MAG: 50S ribosomal protein L22 [Treponema sp.]|jgi:large subunit ribosomal protein L22|nr:50S ribosomal protein L22 [Treponema sp.]
MAEKKEKSGYQAKTKYLLASPYKIRPVADLIRRKPYPEAMSLLENMPHRGAKIIRKTVKSAVSNALGGNKQLHEDMLYVKEILVDEGPRMKRIWFRARGRADMLLKRMCHVTVIIDEVRSSGSARARASSRTSGKAGE